jgi:hypothetical protein
MNPKMTEAMNDTAERILLLDVDVGNALLDSVQRSSNVWRRAEYVQCAREVLATLEHFLGRWALTSSQREVIGKAKDRLYARIREVDLQAGMRNTIGA